ncbi:hypothetical protein BCCGELA001_10925 [Bradyrhizobium sp. CCGE-LA001]|nr:hypothetical protein BCCGELA001_10925 [Bradyrhizobium sp. CCGE-LA001]
MQTRANNFDIPERTTSELNLGSQDLDIQTCSRGNDKPADRILKTFERILNQNNSSATRALRRLAFFKAYNKIIIVITIKYNIMIFIAASISTLT